MWSIAVAAVVLAHNDDNSTMEPCSTYWSTNVSDTTNMTCAEVHANNLCDVATGTITTESINGTTNSFTTYANHSCCECGGGLQIHYHLVNTDSGSGSGSGLLTKTHKCNGKHSHCQEHEDCCNPPHYDSLYYGKDC